MIMADQDHDGSHIKGLLINFFHHFYPDLLKIPGFLLEFITPIIKVNANGITCCNCKTLSAQPTKASLLLNGTGSVKALIMLFSS